MGLGSLLQKREREYGSTPFLQYLMKQMEMRHYSFSKEMQCILKEDLKIKEGGKEKEWNKVLV